MTGRRHRDNCLGPAPHRSLPPGNLLGEPSGYSGLRKSGRPHIGGSGPGTSNLSRLKVDRTDRSYQNDNTGFLLRELGLETPGHIGGSRPGASYVNQRISAGFGLCMILSMQNRIRPKFGPEPLLRNLGCRPRGPSPLFGGWGVSCDRPCVLLLPPICLG